MASPLFFGCGESTNGGDSSTTHKCKYVRHGYDCEGYSLELQRDRKGILRSGLHWETGFDREGYDSEGFNIEGINREGLNREGFNRAGFNQEGFNRAEFNREGFNREGFNRAGFNRAGFNRAGFNRAGFNLEGFNLEGFNREGFNLIGFNRDGFDAFGFNRNGFDQFGFNRDGFDREGFNLDGFDAFGFNCDGFDCDGFNINGVGRNSFAGYGVVPQGTLGQRFGEKIVQLQLGDINSVVAFLAFVSPEGRGNEQFSKDELADFIVEFLEVWWDLRPRVENLIQLIRQNGGTTEKQLNLINILKRGALQRGLVRTVAEYTGLMGEVIPNGFESEAYLDKNSVLIFSTIEPFVESDLRTQLDANQLKIFVEQVRLHIEYDLNRPELVDLLTRLSEIKHQRFSYQVFERLKARVTELFNEIRPEITPDSKFKYYLIRKEEEWAQEVRAAYDGECLACGDAVDHESPGIACRSHAVPFIYHTNPQGEALHPDHDCLFQYVRDRIQGGQFPVNCGDPTVPHELPLTAALLLHLGLDGADIQHWKIQTLLAYYNELLAIRNGRGCVAHEHEQDEMPLYRACKTEACRNIVFRNQVVLETHHYECEICGERACYLCDGQAHLGVTCARAALNTAADWHNPDFNLRPCPYCLTPADKDNGCNSVHCANPGCGREWHFVKGKPRERSFTHDFNAVAQPPRRLYRVIGDLDYVPGQNMESAFPDSDGAIK